MQSALNQWLAIHSIGKRQRTIEFYQEIIEIIRANLPMDQPPNAVTEAMLIEFAQRIAHYCPSRWNQAVSILRAIQPGANILKRRKQRFSEQRPPSQREFYKLLTELDRAHRGHGGLVVRFLAQTGLRIGEARRLTWLDLKDDCLVVPAAIAKNGHSRSIPLINGLPATLAQLRQASDGSLILPQRECKTALIGACKRAGMARLSHHDLRHLYATRCIESGVDVPTVARWLGHQDGGALLGKLYFHLLDGHSRSMAARVRI